MINFFNESIDVKKAFLFLVFFGLMYVYPLISIDVYYADDFMRSATGVFWFKGLGRPLAEYVLNGVSLNNKVNIDVSPLTQIVSIILLALSTIICVSLLSGKPRRSDYFFFSLLVFNPFYIQNLAYKYDSITMSMGVIFACIAVWFICKPSLLNLCFSLASFVASLSFYQSCVSIFCVLAIIVLINRVANFSSSVKRDILSPIMVFLIGHAIYYFLVLKHYAPATRRSELIAFDSSIIDRFIYNIKQLWVVCKKFSPIISSEILFILSSVAMASVIFICIKKKASIVQTFLCGISLPLAFITVGFPTIILNESVFFPRVLIGFGLFLSLCLFSCSFVSKAFNCFVSVVAVLFVFISFVTINAFSNAIDAQNKYQTFVIQSVAKDIINNENLFKATTYVVGKLPFPQNSLLVMDVFPIVKNMSNPSADWTNSYVLRQNGIKIGFSFDRIEQNGLVKELCYKKIIPIIDVGLYSIFNYEKKNLVYVKGAEVLCDNE